MAQRDYLSGINFLIVDDNAFMRATVRRLLEAFGIFNTREAPDGAEAIKFMQNWAADIILTDWVMTPLDGIEFTKIVRNSHELSQRFVPIIIVSAHSEAWRIAEARDAGATEYLVKPLSAATLYSRIHAVVNRPRSFIDAPGYFGPDRRRHQGHSLVERRKSDIGVIPPVWKDASSAFDPNAPQGRDAKCKLPRYSKA